MVYLCYSIKYLLSLIKLKLNIPFVIPKNPLIYDRARLENAFENYYEENGKGKDKY